MGWDGMVGMGSVDVQKDVGGHDHREFACQVRKRGNANMIRNAQCTS